MDGRGCVFGYFFGPKQDVVPQFGEVASMTADTAIYCGQFSHLGLTRGTWPIIGESADWHRSDWPLPRFIAFDDLSQTAQMLTYSDGLELLLFESCHPRLVDFYPRERLSGSGALEIRLTTLIDGPKGD